MEYESLKRLFRQEFSRIVAVIIRRYGIQDIETAEDIAAETFLQAAENWENNGIPPNPAAWLYVVAKQKTLYHFRRNKIFRKKVIPALTSNQREDDAGVLDFSQSNIKDSQLKMMFAVCSPAIASEAQIGLALRILCGFGIDEIAEAFLTNKDTINKRLYRAKEKLRNAEVNLDKLSPEETALRVDNVLHIIYLLFNEGYFSGTKNQILRKDFCLEALRLGLLLTEYKETNLPKSNALVALMCFHASRFNARQEGDNQIILYEQQNEELWDKELIGQGLHYLNLSARGEELSSYHIEARIAYWHCIKNDSKEKWEEILQLYDKLLLINYSPIAALNRIYAFYKVNGPVKAITEAETLNFNNTHLYFLLLGELYKNVNTNKAKSLLQKAQTMAKTETEKVEIQKKIDQLV